MSSKLRDELLQVRDACPAAQMCRPIPITALKHSSTTFSIMKVLSEQDGVVFARPAIVYRGMYAGRGIIAPNSKFNSDMTDFRGYLPVEWWIMSSTEAKNATPLLNEGVCYGGRVWSETSRTNLCPIVLSGCPLLKIPL